VGTRTVTFIDTSRPNDSRDTSPDAPRRTIVTNLWYPARGPAVNGEVANAPAAKGPFPLIVFSHGQSGEPQQYATVLRLWARAGYVVAAPRHPLTIRGSPSVTGDIVNQPADVSFVITRMKAEESALADTNHVAVAGHSSGAITDLAAAFNTCCHDKRIDAVVLEAVFTVPFKGSMFKTLPAVPVLVFHGDADHNVPIALGRSVFDQAKPPKFFVTIVGGAHSPPYRDGPPDAHLVAQASIDFFDRYLKDRDAALTRLTRDVASFPFGRLDAVPK
jgi:fermentation-respiration switch protein FrsA (DUF1100 family)